MRTIGVDPLNIQVRVAGWNIRWNDIPRKEQDEYIARIETVGGSL